LGSGLADAMSHAPQAFSAFAVSIIRQGEARGDLATSFYRIADYLQKEREADVSSAEVTPAQIVNMTSAAPEKCPAWLSRVIYKTLISLGALFAVLFIIEILVALELIAPRWHFACSAFAVTTFLLCVAGRLGHTNKAATQIQSVEKSTFTENNKSTFDKTSEATFE
jgi:hypothetical protein